MRRTGIVVWLGLFGICGLGFALDSEALIGWGFVLSALTAVITYLGLRGRDLVLVHPRLYRALLAPTLLAAFATMVAAGGTIAVGGAEHFSGFIVVGSANLVLAIATWRALLAPSAPRAALLGLFAVVVELFAIVVDAVINFTAHDHGDHHDDETFLIITILAAVVTMGTGGLACIAALASFGDQRTDESLPQAQIVNGSRG